MKTARFAIGTEFMQGNKFPKVCKVVDILTTTNQAGEVVKIRYVATHIFNKQLITETDILETTIAKGSFK